MSWRLEWIRAFMIPHKFLFLCLLIDGHFSPRHLVCLKKWQMAAHVSTTDSWSACQEDDASGKNDQT